MDYDFTNKLRERKIILTILVGGLLLVLIPCSAFGKTNPMKFLGIPMECSLDSFSLAIEAKGYIPQEKDPDYDGFRTKQFVGKFWKWNNCKINVREHNRFKVVTSVIVYTEEGTNFDEIISSLENKYGYYKETDEGSGFVDYTWTLDSGRIIVTEVRSAGLISIKYQDSVEAMLEIMRESGQGNEDDSDL